MFLPVGFFKLWNQTTVELYLDCDLFVLFTDYCISNQVSDTVQVSLRKCTFSYIITMMTTTNKMNGNLLMASNTQSKPHFLCCLLNMYFTVYLFKYIIKQCLKSALVYKYIYMSKFSLNLNQYLLFFPCHLLMMSTVSIVLYNISFLQVFSFLWNHLNCFPIPHISQEWILSLEVGQILVPVLTRLLHGRYHVFQMSSCQKAQNDQLS